MEQINDRITFDKVFCELLLKGYSNEKAMTFLMINYSLSALVFQERIENAFYKEISPDIESRDIVKLKNKIYKEWFINKIDLSIME